MLLTLGKNRIKPPKNSEPNDSFTIVSYWIPSNTKKMLQNLPPWVNAPRPFFGLFFSLLCPIGFLVTHKNSCRTYHLWKMCHTHFSDTPIFMIWPIMYLSFWRCYRLGTVLKMTAICKFIYACNSTLSSQTFHFRVRSEKLFFFLRENLVFRF